MIKILITGATGLVGRELCRQVCQRISSSPIVVGTYKTVRPYIKDEEGVHYKQCDVSDRESVVALLEDLRPDIVFHLGGISSTKLDNDDPAKVFRVITEGTANLISACREGTRFIYTSSATVYGDLGASRVCREEDECRPTSWYGAAKLAAEHLILASPHIIPYILRPVAIVGSTATHGLLPDVARKINGGGPIIMWGRSPGAIKPFVHVHDVANFACQCAREEIEPGTYNLSSLDELSVLAVTRIGLRIANRVSADINWDEKKVWHGDNRIVRVSPEKAMRAGWYRLLHNSFDSVNAVLMGIIG